MRRPFIAAVILSVAVVAAPPTFAEPPATPAAAPTYQVAPPRLLTSPVSGWGLSARLNGYAFDADAVTWVDDPDARSGGLSAGYGWRNQGSSVLFGYQQRGRYASPWAYGGAYSLPGRPSNPGVFGFNFTLKTDAEPGKGN
jgi:hypothetical protein